MATAGLHQQTLLPFRLQLVTVGEDGWVKEVVAEAECEIPMENRCWCTLGGYLSITEAP